MITTRLPRALAALILLGALGSPLFAQVPLFRWDNPNESGVQDSFLAFYRQLSDVDGDGFPEILLPDKSGQTDLVLWVYSLAKQQVLFTIPTSPSGFPFSSPYWLITLTDLNGDGFRDLVVEYQKDFPTLPTLRWVVRAHDGTNGVLLWETDETVLGFPGGRLTNLGDVNQDGVEDIGVATNSHARLLSGVDGVPFLDLSSNDVFGVGVLRPAGDLNGDGFGDIIDNTGNLEFFSGKDGSVLWALPWGVGDGHFRYYAIGVGDVDGDGLDDWAEGWRGDEIGQPCVTPVIAVFHGFPPVEIDRILGREIADPLHRGPYFHFDFDGDGTQDILYNGRKEDVTSLCAVFGGLSPFYVSIYSPARKKFLFTWAHGVVGPLQAMDADWDGDGIPDLLTRVAVGKPFFFPATLQALTLRSHLGVFPKTISRAAGGTLQFSVDAGLRFAGHKAMVLPGTGAEWPFFFQGYNTAGGSMEAIALPFVLTKATTTAWDKRKKAPWSSLRILLDAQGKGTATFTLPPNALPQSLVGKNLFFAAELDTVKPGKPETATEAVTVTVLP
ncbi:MAG: FG-GAP repeat domain-containing protein [Planctomycetota bacterium]